MSNNNSPLSFQSMQLAEPLMQALLDVGYESPSPIQAETIPLVMAGKDLVGQAQTGTGKTAAFALPLLSRIKLERNFPQVLVLTPTRELAIQVAEAFQTYARYINGFNVLPIYGGQDYGIQLRALKRGVHVVVGTPGRVMDHMRRGTLTLDWLTCLVLDEADEMLRMGFIEDVEWVMENSPANRQVVLFSATMPEPIRKIAKQHLHEPEHIYIKNKTITVEKINQRYWMVSNAHKLDALTRILEAETTDGVIIFVRTKITTVELADKLQARGYNAYALSGDIPQKQRERTIEQLKSGKLDFLIATDVAARGLDVDRISHVINYDIPNETDAYIHRIGRTGRAGRTGEAILFITPREQHLLRRIEQTTRQKISRMELPSTKFINDKRIARFKQRITDAIAGGELELYQKVIEDYSQEKNIPAIEIAAALARSMQGKEPLLVKPLPEQAKPLREKDRGNRINERGRSQKREHINTHSEKKSPQGLRRQRKAMAGMETYRIEVGSLHNVQPGSIVGAIANEAGLDSSLIGRIDIHDKYSLIDLPEGMPREIYKDLKNTWVADRKLNITHVDDTNDRLQERKASKKRNFDKPKSEKKSRGKVNKDSKDRRKQKRKKLKK
jgi:ATP-dependent RNA helicase DeaD